MESYSELEQMRLEISELKAKLDRQTIISEEHIRRSMRDKVHRIKVQTTILAVTGIAGAGYCLWALHWFMGLSLTLSAFTVLFLLTAVAFSFWTTRRIHPEDMMGENLAEAGKEIALMRKRGLKWKKYAWPVVLAWFAWVAAECISSGTDNELTLYFLLGCGFGIIGAGICGTIYDRKRKAMLDTLLRQIDELGK